MLASHLSFAFSFVDSQVGKSKRPRVHFVVTPSQELRGPRAHSRSMDSASASSPAKHLTLHGKSSESTALRGSTSELSDQLSQKQSIAQPAVRQQQSTSSNETQPSQSSVQTDRTTMQQP